jgi:4-amino-4-deoxy-L-arabinose transferase-like glycosyltransferase
MEVPELSQEATLTEYPLALQMFRRHLAFWLVLILAVVLRIYWLNTHTVAIETGDGAEYARIAENLLRGKGYVGTMGGPQLIFPPLYPMLIAVFSLATHDAELAGRLVSLLAGVCVIPLVYKLGSRTYGRTAALIGAFLAASNFVLISLSASVLSEGLFTTLLIAGAYYGLRALELDALPDYVLAGSLWGLAYLTRPEAMAFPVILALNVLAVGWLEKRPIRKAIVRCGILSFPFVLMAVPYVVFLSLHTGTFLLDGKHNLNYTIGQRLNSGMNERDAQWGLIEGKSTEQGPLLDSTPFITRSPYSESPGTVVTYVEKSIRRNADRFYHVISGWTFGAPILLLTAIGLFRKPWNRKRVVREIYFLCIVTFLLVLGLSAFLVRARYMIPVLPFFLLWASNGIVELSEWARETVSKLQSRIRSANYFTVVVQCALSLLVILAATGARRKVPELADTSPEYIANKSAGLRLQSFASEVDGKIVDSLPILPYYAGELWVPLPSADSRIALDYIRQKHPSFVVLRSENTGDFPYYKDWLDRGIPDARAKLIYRAGTAPDDELRIYRWLDPLPPTQRK